VLEIYEALLEMLGKC